MVTTIRLPDELHRKLKKETKKRGMTFNALILSILWEFSESRKVTDK